MIFLLCPVRNATPDETAAIDEYVAALEDQGEEVYWPARDTDQDDPTGIRICSDNIDAISRSKAVHVWWSPSTVGGVFDLGATMALNKPVVLINPIERTEKKSFENVIIELDRRRCPKWT